jgi:hypothetical protein
MGIATPPRSSRASESHQTRQIRAVRLGRQTGARASRDKFAIHAAGELA